MRITKILSSLLLVVLVGSIYAQDAYGIPAFARRYKISCTTCHAPFPRLKAYGDEFAAAGFVIREEEKERDYITGGDETLWLNRTFQLGMRFDAWMMLDEDQTLPQSVDSDLQIPWGVKILSGGALTKNIGYYFYFYMAERGEVAGIEDAYIHFDDIGGLPLDLMVGQFQTSDPLMKRELRLSYEDYQVYKQTVGVSQINLTYDRGLMAVYGIESTGTDLVGFLVNGNGKGEAAANRKFDGDRYKNYGFRVNQGIGEFASLGGYFYQGLENLPLAGGTPLEWRQNEVRYFGPDFSLGAGPLSFTGQYMIRQDSNPMGLNNEPAEKIETTGMIGELVYLPAGDDGRHAFVLLYNDLESKDAGIAYRTVSFGSSYLVARNLRLHFEYTRDLENELNRGVFGIVSGF
ncbi:hypothetical protein H8E52_04455 [bacterium]|nr:hypothetical protein [bacterium]